MLEFLVCDALQREAANFNAVFLGVHEVVAGLELFDLVRSVSLPEQEENEEN